MQGDGRDAAAAARGRGHGLRRAARDARGDLGAVCAGAGTQKRALGHGARAAAVKQCVEMLGGRCGVTDNGGARSRAATRRRSRLTAAMLPTTSKARARAAASLGAPPRARLDLLGRGAARGRVPAPRPPRRRSPRSASPRWRCGARARATWLAGPVRRRRRPAPRARSRPRRPLRARFGRVACRGRDARVCGPPRAGATARRRRRTARRRRVGGGGGGAAPRRRRRCACW